MTRVTAVPSSDRLVTLRDGRSLAYAEWGDLGGRPVVLLLGTPGSRLLCPDADATEALGVRLITIDRPGYGRSDPQPNLSLLSWVDDYAELHDLLGLRPCPIVGWSGGGKYALACAVSTPALVSSVGLAASSGPLDEVPDGWGEEDRSLSDLLRRERAAGVEAITKRCQGYADEPASMFAGWNDPDDPDVRLLARPDVHEAMIQWAREGARQGSIGYVADLITRLEPWGFSAAEVTQDVGVWLGERNMEARPHADYFVAAIPGSTLVVYPGDGHLVPLPRWAEMLAWLH